MSRVTRSGLVFLCLALLTGAGAWGTADLREVAPDTRERLAPTAAEVGEVIDAKAATPVSRLAAKFLDKNGGEWTFRGDPRTGRLTLVQGSGLPFYPGKGNTLGPQALAGLDLAEGKITARALEPRVRAFVEDHRGLIGPPVGELVLDDKASLARDDGRLVSIYYDWFVDGVPVEDAKVFVRLNSGNVTQLGGRFVGPIDAVTRPQVKSGAAVQKILEYSGDVALAEVVSEPRLLLQPEDRDSKLAYRLVWTFSYVVPGQVETWEGRVDATTGEVVGFRDLNLYARATGGVYPRNPALTGETPSPLPGLEIFAGGTRVADAGGEYPYAGGAATSSMNGRFFDIDCIQCTNPTQPFVQATVGTGRLDFGTGGTQEVGNGFSTPAGRTTFYHLNVVHRVAQHWLPSLGWLNTLRFPANVNISTGSCGAFYNGSSVNFERSGGSCGNPGLYADIIYHEYGHGLDFNSLGGDGGTSEGTADVAAMNISRSSRIAPFFFGSQPIRELNSSNSSNGVMTVARVDGGYCNFLSGGALSVHCVGQVFGQSAWDLSQALVAKHGHHTGWRTSERLFYTSLPDQGSYRPESGVSIYLAYLNADDDDGNLANGTPNGEEIYDAFRAHGMDNQVATSSPGCDRPTQPSVTLTDSCDGFELEWTPVAGVDHYEILRADLKAEFAYLPVAEVSSGETSYLDTLVAPGVNYWYVVMAVNADGCESTVEGPVPGSLPVPTLLEVSEMTVDDTPRGNRSGFPDPGEEVDITLTLTNRGPGGAAQISGTLTSPTEGVTVLAGSSTWGDLAQGLSGDNQDTLRISVDPSVACGSIISLQLTPESALGCPADPSYARFTLGERIDFDFFCDDAPACFETPEFAGLTSAAPGASCGEALLSWKPAVTHCVDGDLTYNVYRSETPGFVPGPENLVASGVNGTQYVDSVPVPGASYRYVVRATDWRVGEESNSVELQTVSATSPDLGPPVFAGIASATAGTGCGEAVLGWDPAVELCTAPVSYEIHRSTDPAFVPGPDTLVASTLDTTFVDVGLEAAADYTYLVRARDLSGNVESNDVRLTAQPVQIEEQIAFTAFDPTNDGWQTTDVNDATAGRWAWGNPSGTAFQPENDASPSGTHCWMTGLSAFPGDNDVDGGTTTLMSRQYDLSQAADPVVRYARWFTNDRGNAPGELTDRMRLEVSSDDGTNWRAISSVGSGTPLEWVTSQVSLPSAVALTSEMRFRFVVADLGADSTVEAGVDDFELFDRNGGCAGCTTPVAPVGTIVVERSGDDVVVDWTADPADGARFVVYSLSGETFDQALRIASTPDRSFTDAGAVARPGATYYRVSVVDACGQESDPAGQAAKAGISP